jgi:quercetin dioxygenase-like cupin family protein
MARVDDQTTGTEHAGRESRTLSPALEIVDLGAEGVGLLAEPEWSAGDRNSKTLLKSDSLRVVLTALRAGAVMENDDPDEAATIQGLHGTLTVRVGDEEAAVAMGQLVCIGSGTPWRIMSSSDSLFLLSVGRPPADASTGRGTESVS